MVPQNPKAVIVGISSDIGVAVANRWLEQGVTLLGSARHPAEVLAKVSIEPESLIPCDFSDLGSIEAFIAHIENRQFYWNRLVICPGTMEPIGRFDTIDFDEWERGFRINFLSTLRVIRGLLPLRQLSDRPPTVILFAGGGVNSAPKNFSAYTSSKIGLIKMIELLAEEIADTRFTILGPGWVDTKIHLQTLAAERSAAQAAAETRRRIESKDFVPVQRVVDCIEWVLSENAEIVSGRNFSVANDKWGAPGLQNKLRQSSEVYKLRRHSNDN